MVQLPDDTAKDAILREIDELVALETTKARADRKHRRAKGVAAAPRPVRGCSACGPVNHNLDPSVVARVRRLSRQLTKSKALGFMR